MEGTLTSETYGLARFPPKEFRHGDTGDANELGLILIGRLMCNGI